jgi:hypothetical protein
LQQNYKIDNNGLFKFTEFSEQRASKRTHVNLMRNCQSLTFQTGCKYRNVFYPQSNKFPFFRFKVCRSGAPAGGDANNLNVQVSRECVCVERAGGLLSFLAIRFFRSCKKMITFV